MIIRPAAEEDIPQLLELLLQVHALHAEGRPDIFRKGARKYEAADLQRLLADAERPILVAAEGDAVLGYAFCVLQRAPHASMTDIRTLYIDDLCVDATRRSGGIGTALYQAVLQLARQHRCYNVTLNVWSCNPSALAFYQRCGMAPQKICMEHILEGEGSEPQ